MDVDRRRNGSIERGRNGSIGRRRNWMLIEGGMGALIEGGMGALIERGMGALIEGGNVALEDEKERIVYRKFKNHLQRKFPRQSDCTDIRRKRKRVRCCTVHSLF